MLWPVIKPPRSSLYWLDQVHKNFYLSLFRGEEYQDCFPVEFGLVLDVSTKTDEYFSAVYQKYNVLLDEHKESFRQIYNQQVAIAPVYSDARVILLKPNIKAPTTDAYSGDWDQRFPLFFKPVVANFTL